MAEDTLLYRSMTATAGFRNPSGSIGGGSDGRVGWINLPRQYAALNRKNMRHTDNKGYPLAYVVEVEAIGDTTQAHQVEIYTAPETWVLKNAVRKWHIARNAMLERLGQLGKVGEYGKTIRPYLTIDHASQGDAIPTLFAANGGVTYTGGDADNDVAYHESADAVASGIMNGGEWTYTRVAHESAYDATEGTGNMAQSGPPVDSYALVLTGDHDGNSGSETSNIRTFTHVSMMRSYLESRRNQSVVVQNPSGGGTINKEPSPLSDLMTDSLSATEVREIIQDIQREKPPYDDFSTSAGSELNANDSLDLIQKCLLSTSTSYIKDKEVIRVPMGLLHVRATASDSIGESNVKVPGLRFRLLGIDKCQG